MKQNQGIVRLAAGWLCLAGLCGNCWAASSAPSASAAEPQILALLPDDCRQFGLPLPPADTRPVWLLAGQLQPVAPSGIDLRPTLPNPPIPKVAPQNGPQAIPGAAEPSPGESLPLPPTDAAPTDAGDAAPVEPALPNPPLGDESARTDDAPPDDTSAMDIILGGLCLLAAVGMLGGFLYVCFFKAGQSNHPNVARAAGLGTLGGIVLAASELMELGHWAVGLGAVLIAAAFIVFCLPEK
jgi:hypothetical protein